MNPAVLATNLSDLRTGGILIVNTGAFTVKNLELAGYPSNPLEDGSLEKYRLVKIDISKLVGLALEGSSLGTKDAGRCKNFWALGLMFWMYQRDTERELQSIKEKFGKKPELADANIRAFGAAAYFPYLHARQGIVHVMGPENGATLPGMTVVCGDSHTSTHGAFACLAHGIGTSEVEHVMATQCLLQKKSRTMLIQVDGELGAGVTAKDIVLAIIGRIGTAGGTGYTIEFAGSAIRSLSMEGRMTVCNMAIEAGARAGLVAVDDTTIDYVKGRPFSPRGVELEQAVAYWRTLHSDAGAHFDAVIELDAAHSASPRVAR